MLLAITPALTVSPAPATAATSSAAAQTSACVQAPTGVVAWWPFDGNANDLAGGNNGTTVGGASFAAGEVGNALQLDGSTGFVSVPDSPAWAFGSADFTIEFWTNFTQLNTLQAFIGQFDSLSANWAFLRFPGDLNFTIGPADADIAAPIPTLNQWYHYAVTRSGGSLYSFYVDGSLVSTQTYAAAVPDLSSTLTIGQRGSSFYLNGLLDEVSIYNRALGAGEITAISGAGVAGKCKPAATVFNVCPLYDQTKAVKSGATIPIKLQLCDSNGNNLSSSSIVVTAVSIVRVSDNAPGVLEDAGNSNPDNNFRFTGGAYQFNLKTTGYATGTYNLNFQATGDSTTHTVQFQVK